ncbi:MAG TPA: 3-oxoacyl-[acyl-carrier-protein] synthase III C-terminal domain-containing protein [bacterium]
MEPTSHVLNTALALPAHAHAQEDIRDALLAWLRDRPDLAERAASIIANAEVRRRFTVRPLEWYVAHTSVTERSEVYRDEMICLCEAAARQALEEAGVAPTQVGLVISTSCTGVMIPSVETYLISRMGFRPQTRRQPLTEMGCVAGAAALSQADIFLRAHPESAVLIVSAELASLTAQVTDFSLANIVSAALFGDGAAATVVVGPRFAHNGHGSINGRKPAGIVATRSVLFPDTPEMMGFDNTDGGLKIFLSPRVPRFLRQNLPREVAPFLEEHGLRLSDLRHFLLHPGGRKVLEGLQRELHLNAEDTRFSWRALGEYGNLSSATVLFMLHHFEREATPLTGEYGLLAAVGPGFCAELVLLQW